MIFHLKIGVSIDCITGNTNICLLITKIVTKTGMWNTHRGGNIGTASTHTLKGKWWGNNVFGAISSVWKIPKGFSLRTQKWPFRFPCLEIKDLSCEINRSQCNYWDIKPHVREFRGTYMYKPHLREFTGSKKKHICVYIRTWKPHVGEFTGSKKPIFVYILGHENPCQGIYCVKKTHICVYIGTWKPHARELTGSQKNPYVCNLLGHQNPMLGNSVGLISPMSRNLLGHKILGHKTPMSGNSVGLISPISSLACEQAPEGASAG